MVKLKRQKLPGSVTISHPMMSDIIHIEFTDEISQISFVEFEMSLKDFARALTGMGNVEGTIEIRNLGTVGWKAENKTEEIYVPAGMSDKGRKEIARVVKTLEVDGWRAREGDVENHHNWKGNTVSVVFFRHVKPD